MTYRVIFSVLFIAVVSTCAGLAAKPWYD